MKIDRRTAGDITILAFTGDFDAVNLPKVQEGVDALIEQGHNKLVFNLHLLKFINSSALGYLIKTSKRLREEEEGELVLSQPGKFFRSTVATLGLDTIFKIFPGDEDAVRYFTTDEEVAEAEVGEVPVNEKLLGSTVMFFRLADDPEAGMAVAKMLSIYEDGPTFKYPTAPDKQKIDPDELTIGRSLWIKFRQPFLEKEKYFEMQAEVVMAVDMEDDPAGASKYRLRYTEIQDGDRKNLEQFVHDQDLLRSEARPKKVT